jgi:hypothetical protein
LEARELQRSDMFIEIKAPSSIPTTLFRDGKAKKGERKEKAKAKAKKKKEIGERAKERKSEGTKGRRGDLLYTNTLKGYNINSPG